MTKFAIEQMIRANARASFPYLIEIYLNDDDVIYMCNSDEDVQYGDITYEAACFSFTQPEKSYGTVSDTSITFSNVSQMFIDMIRNNSSKSKIKIIGVMNYYNNTYVVEPIEEMEFKLTSLSWTRKTLKWNMVFDELMQDLVPSTVCDSFVCPALV